MTVKNGSWNLSNNSVALARCARGQGDDKVLELGFSGRSCNGLLRGVDSQSKQRVQQRLRLPIGHFIEIFIFSQEVCEDLSKVWEDRKWLDGMSRWKHCGTGDPGCEEQEGAVAL